MSQRLSNSDILFRQNHKNYTEFINPNINEPYLESNLISRNNMKSESNTSVKIEPTLSSTNSIISSSILKNRRTNNHISFDNLGDTLIDESVESSADSIKSGLIASASVSSLMATSHSVNGGLDNEDIDKKIYNHFNGTYTNSKAINHLSHQATRYNSDQTNVNSITSNYNDVNQIYPNTSFKPNINFSNSDFKRSQKKATSGLQLKWRPSNISTDFSSVHSTSPLIHPSPQGFPFDPMRNGFDNESEAPITPSKTLKTVYSLAASKNQPQPDPANIYISKLLYGIGFLFLSFSFFMILMFSLVSKLLVAFVQFFERYEMIRNIYEFIVPSLWKNNLLSYKNFLWLEWHYSLLLLLIVPVVVFFTYLNWLSMKYFRHN